MPEAAAPPRGRGSGTAPDAAADGVVLAFDFGARRIGVAIANPVTRAARPLALIDAVGDARWARIAALVQQWQPVRFVVGIPRHPDGAPHALTARCEKFARQLHGRFARPVARVDERYSSAVVESERDDLAAAVILQQWLEETAAETLGARTGRRSAGTALESAAAS